MRKFSHLPAQNLALTDGVSSPPAPPHEPLNIKTPPQGITVPEP